MALPKKNRLASKKDIDRAFKKGRTVRRSFLFIRFFNNKKEYSRFVFIVPAKYVSLAVNRNKIKRVLSGEITRALLPRCGYDIIVVICKKIERRNFKKLVEELREIITEIEKLKN